MGIAGLRLMDRTVVPLSRGSKILLGGITKPLWTYTKFLTARPIRDIYGIIDAKRSLLLRGGQRTNLVNVFNEAGAEQHGGGTADSSTITFPGLPIRCGFGFFRCNLFLSQS
jgi:hypothetical protein